MMLSFLFLSSSFFERSFGPRSRLLHVVLRDLVHPLLGSSPEPDLVQVSPSQRISIRPILRRLASFFFCLPADATD